MVGKMYYLFQGLVWSFPTFTHEHAVNRLLLDKGVELLNLVVDAPRVDIHDSWKVQCLNEFVRSLDDFQVVFDLSPVFCFFWISWKVCYYWDCFICSIICFNSVIIVVIFIHMAWLSGCWTEGGARLAGACRKTGRLSEDSSGFSSDMSFSSGTFDICLFHDYPFCVPLNHSVH